MSSFQVIDQEFFACKKPILANDVAKEVRLIGASIWLLQKGSYGLLFRCEIGARQFRLILPPLVGQATDLPQEGKVPLYIITDLTSLRNWLQALSA